MNRLPKPEFRMISLAGVCLVALVAAFLQPSVAGAAILGTGSPSLAACCFGDEIDTSVGRSDVRTIGQTFVMPTNATAIDSFSFWLKDFNGEGSGLQYKAYLMDWDAALNGGIATGSVLYESSAMNGSTSATLEKVTFSPAGGQSITGGNDYVIFLSTLAFPAGTSRNAIGSFPFNPVLVDPYADGNGVVFTGPSGNQSDPFSAITDLANGGSCTNCWNALSPYADAAFEVSYLTTDTVPEPATLAVVGLGLAGLGVASRRRRTR